MNIFSFLLFFTIKTHAVPQSDKTLAVHDISMNKRNDNRFVNEIFRDNILLNLAYMSGKVVPPNISWSEIDKPFNYAMVLRPGEVFAFHDDILSEYQKPIKTTNTHFNSEEGYKYDGYLVGDGVCHLASLMNWVASEAGLETKAPNKHNFADIPQVPQKFGTSIYYYPGQYYTNSMHNLYIRNNKGRNVYLKFSYNGEKLTLSIILKS